MNFDIGKAKTTKSKRKRFQGSAIDSGAAIISYSYDEDIFYASELKLKFYIRVSETFTRTNIGACIFIDAYLMLFIL